MLDRRLIVGSVAALILGVGLSNAMAARVMGATPATASTSQPGNIVEVASGAGQFSVLLKAAQAAGLADTLAGPGPFTVFAPTDEAFGKLDKHALANLLKPENKDRLAAILSFHVVSGKVGSEDAVRLGTGGSAATTVNGQRLPVTVKDGKLRVGDANVVATDIAASNGVIHVIDKVLIPAKDSIVTIAAKDGRFKTLIAAAKAAGLADTLSSSGSFTIFAPTDAAFEKLPAGLVEKLLRPENMAGLKAVLQYHVVQGRLYSNDLLASGNVRTLEGGNVRAAFKDAKARVNNSSLLNTDIDASNGVIHVIDEVLVPGDIDLAALKSAPASSKAEPAMKLSGDKLTAVDLIDLAIERGVPQFNNGNPQACAAVYEVLSRSLLSLGGTEGTMSATGDARVALQMGLEQASQKTDAGERAWALRRGLDAARAALTGSK